MIFADRGDAGQKLAEVVVKKVQGKGIVLGIPRGGVVVAKIVAEKLGWPLQVIRAKKIGASGNPELAVGAKVRPPLPDLGGVNQAVVVDDGVATGYTMAAAINCLRGESSQVKVIVVLPVAAKDSAERLKKICDDWICLSEPADLQAVGQYYREFGQVSDEEVVKLLHEVNRRVGQPRS